MGTHINKHTVSLKLAKKMKALKWEKETLFGYTFKGNIIHNWPDKYKYPAPIASEILEELPMKIWLKDEQFPKKDDERVYYLGIHKQAKDWRVEYLWRESGEVAVITGSMIDAPTPANVLCDMWIFLKEEGLL